MNVFFVVVLDCVEETPRSTASASPQVIIFVDLLCKFLSLTIPSPSGKHLVDVF